MALTGRASRRGVKVILNKGSWSEEGVRDIDT